MPNKKYSKIEEAQKDYNNTIHKAGREKYELKKTFAKLATVGNAYKVSKYYIQKIDRAISNRNYLEAADIYLNHYQKISSNSQYKAMLSPGEMQKFFNSGSKVKDFCSKMTKSFPMIETADKYAKRALSCFDVICELQHLRQVSSRNIKAQKDKISRATQIRREFRKAQQQMESMMKLSQELIKFAPPGMGAYLKFNLEAFKACSKGFDIVNQYAENIEHMLEEIERLSNSLGKQLGGRKFIIEHPRTFIKSRNLDKY